MNKGKWYILVVLLLVITGFGCGIYLQDPTPLIIIATETPTENKPAPPLEATTAVEIEEATEPSAPEETAPLPSEETEETSATLEENVPPAMPLEGVESLLGAPCTVLVPAGSSIQDAVDRAIPGNVICLANGTYAEEIIISVSGTNDNPIIITATNEKGVVLDGKNELFTAILFKPGVAHVQLLGMTIQNYNDWGLDVEGDNNDIVLDQLDISGGEAGIHFTVGDSGTQPMFGPVNNITVTNSQIRDTIYTAVDCTPGPCDDMTFRNLLIEGAGLEGESSFGADGLAIERGHHLLVEDSMIRNNGGDGIDLNSRDTDGYAEGIFVRRNQVVNNRLQAIKLWAGGRMENNLITGQGINPIIVGVFPSKVEVVNNTIAYNMWDPAYAGRDYAFTAAYPEIGYSPPVELALVNNIFAFNTGPDVGSPTGIYLGQGVIIVERSNNLFYSRADCEIQADFMAGETCLDPAGITGDGWGIMADPLFVSDYPDPDLHLKAGSPAINAGSTTRTPTVDLGGNTRDANPDIGAYEAN
jgi:hypothetical protein